jgi:hypothetical protein
MSAEQANDMAAGFDHAWELAWYSKSFFETALRHYSGALDLTPGGEGLKRFDWYKRSKHSGGVSD